MLDFPSSTLIIPIITKHITQFYQFPAQVPLANTSRRVRPLQASHSCHQQPTSLWRGCVLLNCIIQQLMSELSETRSCVPCRSLSALITTTGSNRRPGRMTRLCNMLHWWQQRRLSHSIGMNRRGDNRGPIVGRLLAALNFYAAIDITSSPTSAIVPFAESFDIKQSPDQIRNIFAK